MQMDGIQAECDEVVAAQRTQIMSLEHELEVVRGKEDVLKKTLEDRRTDIVNLRCVNLCVYVHVYAYIHSEIVCGCMHM